MADDNFIWHAKSKNGARGLLTTLNRPDLKFLLIVFSKILLKTIMSFQIDQINGKMKYIV